MMLYRWLRNRLLAGSRPTTAGAGHATACRRRRSAVTAAAAAALGAVAGALAGGPRVAPPSPVPGGGRSEDARPARLASLDVPCRSDNRSVPVLSELTEGDFLHLIFGDGELEAQGDHASVTNAERENFDRLLEEILAELPDQLHQLLEEVPLIVEDEPSPPMVHRLARARGADPRKFGRAMKRQLCGLFTGIPLTERSVQHSGMLNDEIRLFRNGILIAAGYRRAGRHHIADDAICEQIRVTLLHEIGHHFGLDEDDLEALGYG